MASPFTVVATAVKSIFDTEFAPEGFTLINDRLHESLGRSVTVAGIFPVTEGPMDRDANTLEHWSEIRLYLAWPQEILPATVVDPTIIADYAERFRRAMQRAMAVDTSTEQVWYFDVRDISYPPDPTGNSSRFHARIRAYGNNSAVIETSD